MHCRKYNEPATCSRFFSNTGYRFTHPVVQGWTLIALAEQIFLMRGIELSQLYYSSLNTTYIILEQARIWARIMRGICAESPL